MNTDNQQKKLENILISALETGFVVFYYRKVNGEKRAAVGTSNISLIKQISCWRPKCEFNCHRGGSYAYYDLIDEDWRSFRLGNVIDITIDNFGCPADCKYRYISDTQTAIRMAIKYAADKGDTDRIESLVDLLIYGQTVINCDKVIADIKCKEDIIECAHKEGRSYEEILRDMENSAEEMNALVNEMVRKIRN